MNHQGKEEFDSAKIFYQQTGKILFYTDFLSICGNTIFQNEIWANIKVLQLFKLVRILKLNNMIVTSNLSSIQKTYGVICKLILYLLLYFHILACGWWKVLGLDAGIEFNKLLDGLPLEGLNDCVYVNTDDGFN